MNAYLRIIGGLCVGRKRSASSCQRSALSYRSPFKLQSIFIKEPSVVSDQQSELNRLTRSIGKLISKRKPPVVSSRLSDMARHIRAISRLKPKIHQLSAIGGQPSDTSRWLPAISKLMPKAYHLIPLLILVFVSCGAVLAQEPVGHTAPAAKAEKEIIPLKIGDRVPDELWNLPLQVVNHPEGKETITLNDYKGKLIILDFWATWCTPCIRSLDELSPIQMEFEQDVIIIPISYQAPGRIATFIHNRQWTFFSVANDNKLNVLFNAKSLPHLVWISGKKAAMITGSEVLKPEILKDFLENGKTKVLMKDEETLSNVEHSLFNNDVGVYPDRLLYQSVFSKPLNNRSGGNSFKDGIIRYLNATVEGLYYVAVGSVIPFTGKENRIIFEIPDSIRAVITPPLNQYSGDFETDSLFEVWRQHNMFCYSIVVPGYTKIQLERAMLQELNNFFGKKYGIHGIIEKRNVMSLVLEKFGKADATYHRSLISTYEKEAKNQFIFLESKPINTLLFHLNNRLKHLGLPVINNTNYEGNMDILLQGDFDNLDRINEQLYNYGLKISKKNWDVEMLIIKQST